MGRELYIHKELRWCEMRRILAQFIVEECVRLDDVRDPFCGVESSHLDDVSGLMLSARCMIRNRKGQKFLT